MYLEFLASCSVAEHHPQGTTGIEPRDGTLTTSQVDWLHSAMWLWLLLCLIFARWTLQTAIRNLRKEFFFYFDIKKSLQQDIFHIWFLVWCAIVHMSIMQSFLLILPTHALFLSLVFLSEKNGDRTWLDEKNMFLSREREREKRLCEKYDFEMGKIGGTRAFRQVYAFST